MFQRFQEFVKKEKLLPAKGKTLLAVSGGMDSVVMADLYYRAGYPAAIAHCNFKLRGEESEEDQAFVRRLAEAYDFPFYTKNFDTQEYANQNGISIQMAAREIRYRWFERLLESPDMECLAAGHHLDDSIETFFINLMRGCGIRGLHGILPRQGHLVHPLLFATREDIESYIRAHGLQYREDSSNRSEKYQRNKIRHRLLPLIEEMHKDYRQTFGENFERIRQAEQIFKQKVHEEYSKVADREGPDLCFDIGKLKELHPPETYLYEFLAPYGFHYRDIKKIVVALDSVPGKQFYSEQYLLLKDREKLILSEREEVHESFYTITEDMDYLEKPARVNISKRPYTKDTPIRRERNIAMLDYDKLQFPLKLRRWKQGDRFQPLGMKQMKLLSDFFIDNKLSVLEKERVWILESGMDIVWVAGQRIDERYKVTKDTQWVYQLEWLDDQN